MAEIRIGTGDIPAAIISYSIEQSIENNTSTLKITGLSIFTGYYGTAYVNGIIDINGKTVLTLNAATSAIGNGTTLSKYGTSAVGFGNVTHNPITIQHEQDGTKDGITFLVSVSAGYSGKSMGGSYGTAITSLPAIPRTSTVETLQDTVQMGKELGIVINRASPAFTHKLYSSFGRIERELIATDVGGSYAYTVPDLAHECNNALSGTATIECETYSGSTMVGTSFCTVTLTVQDPIVPAIADSEAVMGTAKTVSCKRTSNNFSVKLEYSFYGVSGTIASGRIDSYPWTPAYSLASKIPNLTYGTGQIKCTTYNGTAVVGTQTVTVKLIVPENDTTRPKLSKMELSPVSALEGALGTLYIRGRSGVRAAFTASSAYSTIAKYTLTVGADGVSGNPAQIDSLPNDGEIRVTGTVTDARGFTASLVQTINVLPYQKPRVIPYTGNNSVICERANQSGELTPDGTFLAIRAGRSFTHLTSGGTEYNSCILRYRMKPGTAAEYGPWTEMIGAAVGNDFVSALIANVVSDTSTSYDIQLNVRDALGEEHTMSFGVMTKVISFKLYDGPDGAAFGKEAEEPHMVDIASHMTLRVRGRLIVEGGEYTDLGLADGVRESTEDIGRFSGCGFRVDNGNHVYIACNAAFSFTGGAVLLNRTPLPENVRPQKTVIGILAVNVGLAAISVTEDGNIIVFNIVNLTGEGTDVLWMDGSTEYFI